MTPGFNDDQKHFMVYICHTLSKGVQGRRGVVNINMLFPLIPESDIRTVISFMVRESILRSDFVLIVLETRRTLDAVLLEAGWVLVQTHPLFRKQL